MASALPSIILATVTAIESMSSAEVEKAYWDCEFTATQGPIDLDGAAACSEIYEYLKKDKFLGDFDRFLVWWKENKGRELSTRRKLKQLRREQ